MYIIAGPNGSGKSTFARELIKETHLVFVNADVIAQELSPDQVDRSLMVHAGRVFFQQVNALLDAGDPFIIETTLSGRYATKIVNRLKKEGHKVKMIYILVETPLLSIARIKIRVQSGGHDVPDEDVIRRYSRSKYNFWHSYRQLVDGWEIYDNSGKRFRPVAIGKGPDYIIIDHEMFETFREDI
jgi:predicted ABC-type ATPase